MVSLGRKMGSMNLESEMESINCEVCFQQFNENTKAPRTMNCGHSLCTECIDREISDGQIKCPFCRKEHNAISAKVIPISYSFLKVVEALKKLEVGSSRKVKKQDGDTSLSPHVAIEPQLHAGICKNHGSYKFFWCQKCKVWLCRDCTVLVHPTSTCSILDIGKAFTLLKREENIFTSESQTRRNKHISILKGHMTAIMKRKMVHNYLLKRLQKLMDDIKIEIADLETEYERVKISICNSNSINEQLVCLNKRFADTVKANELMILKTLTQHTRGSVESWIDISQKELESSKILKMTKERQTVMNWALRVSDIKTVDVTILQPILHRCIQEAVTEGVLTLSSLIKMNTKLTMCLDDVPMDNGVSLVTQTKKGVRVHTVCKGHPPANSIKLPHVNLKNLEIKRLGFITLDCKGKIFGPVYFSLNNDCPETKDILYLLVGKGIRLLVNSELVQTQSNFYFEASGSSSRSSYTCYGITIGAIRGELGSIEDLLEMTKVTKNRFLSIASSDATNNEVSEKGLCGWVTLNRTHGIDSLTFWYKEEKCSYLYYGSGQQQELPQKLGKVVEGMEAIRELVKEPSSYNYNKIVKKVVDCGLYYEE